ncbi:Puromycin-sensitive aminopeptidase-like Protein [Tribolium castaneum]|uniref:Puromycin-sensitive aminopeptidase-like Protein n=2 Tax=Tribolium castaneum TaxID=7070 RepID=A0A139WKE9_TRICA|nr:Puromycin-sensitive aminopeptidase-like Protein [Tribolium castaneum]
MSRVGRDLAWRFFVDNWSLFNDRYKGYLLTRLVKFVAENFASEESAKEVEEFFKTHDISGTERTVQQAVETIRLNAAWLKRDTNAIKNYLTSN